MHGTVYINEIKVGARGAVTYRETTHVHAPLPPLSAELRSEYYFVWERTQGLARYATTGRPMHPQDWQWEATAWAPHAPVDDVLAARGFAEDGAGWPDVAAEDFDPFTPARQAVAA